MYFVYQLCIEYDCSKQFDTNFNPLQLLVAEILPILLVKSPAFVCVFSLIS